MSNAVYAPGSNGETSARGATFRPGRGPGGQFANFLMGSTPKYAINNGVRGDFFKNTMARMYVRVEQQEMNLFLNSIGDAHTRSQLAPVIAGDPTRGVPQRGDNSGNAGSNPRRTSATNVQTNGYLDFLISQVQHTFQEKYSVSETLSDNYVAMFYGQTAPIWTYQGYLINTVQDDQASNMTRLYLHLLRGTQMARRQKSISLRYDSYVVNGVMTNLQMTLQAANELVIPFSFQLLVKRIFITNYTTGWVPLRADTPFSADLNAIAFDGRPRESNAIVAVTARIPAENEETPVRNTTADARTNEGVQESSMTPATANAETASFTPATPPPTATPPQNSSRAPATPPLLVSRAPRRSSPAVQNYSSRPETVAPSGLSSNASSSSSSSVSSSTPLASSSNADSSSYGSWLSMASQNRSR